MKKFYFVLFTALCSLALFVSCQRNAKELTQPFNDSNTASKGGSSGCGLSCKDYNVSLVRDVTSMPGKTVFTWEIYNPCPGNGTNGSIQNLSHWSFLPGICLDDNWQDVVAASYRYGGSGDFTPISPLPIIEPDPSLRKGGCYGDDVFKFDYGTSGSLSTFYRMVLNGNWGTGNLDVIFKSGTNTGCCTASFDNKGIGCRIDEDCSFSQGYFFANNKNHPDGVHPWAINAVTPTVTIGGFMYTNAEGLAIWNASNSGGIKDSKKAFTQLAAIKLSGATSYGANVAAAITTIECWLATVGKLSPSNLPSQANGNIATCGNAKAAAGVISDWINSFHCND